VAGVVVEDGGQISLGEPAMHGGMPECPVHVAGIEQL
jgi:hypothetical protein